MSEINAIKEKIHSLKRQATDISYDDSFNLACTCAKLLRNEPDNAREAVIRIHDIMDRIPPNTFAIWNDITESAGLYPYVNPNKLSNSGKIRYEYHRSRYLPSIIFHEEQAILSHELLNKKAVVLSAPTSFGKSLLIEELIASNIYNNIVIIQPTLALIDETRRKIAKYHEQYKLVLSTNQKPSETKKNIFLFTGERVIEYKDFPPIEFFIIDEFYKLSLDREDDRAIALNQAFSRLLTYTNRFYLLGPMISSIPLKFKERFDLTWFPTKYSTVAVNEYNVEEILKYKVDKKNKNSALIELLKPIKNQTIIYCSSPQKATERAIDFYNSMKGITVEKNILADIRSWIKENINELWSLSEALSHRIAFHHGALPRHLGASIVEAFNNGEVQFLFCTSTLIEGVNTSAKNVILFDHSRGRSPIDYFDYRNIAGRSGRMKQHFIGNVIKFEKEPEQMELDVDIPIFNQANAPLEVLISLEKDQIDDEGNEKLADFNKLPEETRNVIKQNTGISIDSQLSIIRKIESNLEHYNENLAWSSVPKKFNDLSTVIELGWEYLLGPGDQTYIPDVGRLTARWLASFAFSYINIRSIKGLINQYSRDAFWIEKIPDLQRRHDIITYAILHISRHWFDYKLPKWLSVISNIQEYTFKKHNMKYGNFLYVASELENSFIHQNLAALTEYDIPSSAIVKLKKFISTELTADQNINRIVSLSDDILAKSGLGEYEMKKIINLKKTV